MVIAGVTIDRKHEKKLHALGVRDSKTLSPKRREELAIHIESMATNMVVIRVQPCKIDTMRSQGINLDKIEAMKMAEIIDMCDGKVYVDSLEQNSKKFRQLLVSYMKNKKRDMVVENYMDESSTVVGAASIIAKVERDRAVQEIKDKVNFDFGVGYPHDERTIEFIRKLIKEHKEDLPPFVRKSWVTTQALFEQSWQKRVKDFVLGRKEECKEKQNEN
jgi:ribonuclease HII